LFAEGQRRYLESLNAYARQFVEPAGRADVDAVYGIPPTVAIEQRTSRGGRKSTVATLTEIYHFLRLMFVKLGVQHCPDCGVPIDAQSLQAIHAKVMKRYRGKRVALLAPLVIGRKGYYTEIAEWASSRGYPKLRVDGVDTPTDPWPRLDRFKEHDIELPVAELTVGPKTGAELQAALEKAVGLGRNMVRVVAGAERGGKGELFSTERACPQCSRSFEPLDPRLFSYNSRYGWCPACLGTGVELPDFDDEQSGEEAVWAELPGEAEPCAACEGKRLKPEALAVRFHDESIASFTARSVAGAHTLFKKLRLDARERAIARDVLPELVSRLGFLELVGLGYL
jgi:excinuclease ABC subunit A